ncbi:23S rRNA (uracil(747)-C(5))-methyltransferase RlmC [Cnuibacter physcomitrellae]|uniref:23S rRNA (Uracil(747)-C(5))-methyltransferase n=1 Tax=Cnuibacter physcomitrellae TaxID=1619308 RepID=A0A1X9LR20_9MICO|nr:23S rRNA (uracil(747)-C(5))-methyltransferase RlmC [Cnuibacter physcomitrellae]ARJ04350.1 23S rRNA (uracil(747)-C(5))-methyltransferase [Cnuibacter physcomitrellae]GGI40840.1 23S rRNA (uracil(747)-C(5))-methyltransferase RlmC [Cnuibacter physcomitrellae]
MQCSYFDAGLCRSCSLLETPYAQQLALKQARVEDMLSTHSPDWLPPIASPEQGFRNKAKMVVGGTTGAPTLGILDGRGRGVDIRGCALHVTPIHDALPALARFITVTGLHPYDVPSRRGDLKYVLVTANSDGELLVRFVVRSEDVVSRLRRHLPALQEALPNAVIVTANLLPEHKAVTEGEREIVLTSRDRLTMTLAGLRLELRPQSFFQTNTPVADQLYGQAREWVDELSPASVWDLYCGVGGFALACASPGRAVLGVETSVDAVLSARATARLGGLDDVRFEAGDATEAALRSQPDEHPDLVIVNPPRRGIGETLARWLDASAVEHVVYSSCNPVTLARDLEWMPGFRMRRARALDMFPHTAHLEVVTMLERVR